MKKSKKKIESIFSPITLRIYPHLMANELLSMSDKKESKWSFKNAVSEKKSKYPKSFVYNGILYEWLDEIHPTRVDFFMGGASHYEVRYVDNKTGEIIAYGADTEERLIKKFKNYRKRKIHTDVIYRF